MLPGGSGTVAAQHRCSSPAEPHQEHLMSSTQLLGNTSAAAVAEAGAAGPVQRENGGCGSSLQHPAGAEAASLQQLSEREVKEEEQGRPVKRLRTALGEVPLQPPCPGPGAAAGAGVSPEAAAVAASAAMEVDGAAAVPQGVAGQQACLGAACPEGQPAQAVDATMLGGNSQQMSTHQPTQVCALSSHAPSSGATSCCWSS